MRLLVLNYEYPPLGGGAGNATYCLGREWGKAGHTVDIVTTWFHGHEEITKESDKVTVYRVKSRRKKAGQSNPLEMVHYVFKGYSRARDLCRRARYDTAISFFAIPTGVIAYRLFKKFSIPYVVLLRGGDVPGFLHKELGLFHALTMPFARPVWRNARRIIANGKSLQILANKTAHGLHCDVDMVPNGVDVEFFRPAPNQPQGRFTFVFSGRFVPQKNLFCLLEQFELLATAQELKLVLVGEGPEQAGLEKRIKSSPILSKTVSLYPWSSKETLRGLYQTAHCFVNPSFEEGMPNTLLEAMACGLPAIASNVGGNNELVEEGKNGLLFDIRDAAALGKAMQKMPAQSDIIIMGAHSRRIVSTQFSWMRTAVHILDKIQPRSLRNGTHPA
jgi:glycosyltransferase involved in cell wall biosynthesis